jgi:hypothetical protein
MLLKTTCMRARVHVQFCSRVDRSLQAKEELAKRTCD